MAARMRPRSKGEIVAATVPVEFLDAAPWSLAWAVALLGLLYARERCRNAMLEAVLHGVPSVLADKEREWRMLTREIEQLERRREEHVTSDSQR